MGVGGGWQEEERARSAILGSCAADKEAGGCVRTPKRAVASGKLPVWLTHPGGAATPGGWRPTSSLIRHNERWSSQWHDRHPGPTGARRYGGAAIRTARQSVAQRQLTPLGLPIAFINGLSIPDSGGYEALRALQCSSKPLDTFDPTF